MRLWIKVVIFVLCAVCGTLSAQFHPVWLDADFSIFPERCVSMSGHVIGTGDEGEIDDGALILNGSNQAYFAVFKTGDTAVPDGKTLSGMLRFTYNNPGWFSDPPSSANSVYFGSFEILLDEKKIPSIRFYAKKGDLLGPYVLLEGKDPVLEDEFADVVFRYSVTEQKAEFFLNGKLQAEKQGNLPELSMELPYAGQNFLGKISRFRLYDGYLEPDSLTMKKPSAEELTGLMEKLEKIMKQAENPFLRNLAETMLKMKDRLAVYGCTVSEWKEYSRRVNELNTLIPFRNRSVFAVFSASDRELEKFDPAKLPGLTQQTNSLHLVTARNLQDHAGFVIYPLAKVPKFQPVLSELKSPEGNVIPVSALRIRALERRYIDTTDKQYIYEGLPVGKSVLVPAAFTADPQRSRVDETRRRNELRVIYPDTGISYLPLKKIPARFSLPEPETLESTAFPVPCLAQAFLLEVKADHVPAGLYSGKLKLMADGRLDSELNIQVNILPLVTPHPAQTLEYDPVWRLIFPDKGINGYLACWQGIGGSEEPLKGITDKEQLRLKLIELLTGVKK